MTKDQVLHAIEDLLDSDIPLNQYHIIIDRDNGDSSITLFRCDYNSIGDMYKLSEIFNSYTTEWTVSADKSRITLYIK